MNCVSLKLQKPLALVATGLLCSIFFVVSAYAQEGTAFVAVTGPTMVAESTTVGGQIHIADNVVLYRGTVLAQETMVREGSVLNNQQFTEATVLQKSVEIQSKSGTDPREHDRIPVGAGERGHVRQTLDPV